jgi:hypothetical protein
MGTGDRDWHYYQYRRRSRDNRAEYMAVWRAVKTLEQRGMVTTSQHRPDPELAQFLLPKDRRPWISVELVGYHPSHAPNIVVWRGDGPDPQAALIAADWRTWAEREGYQPIQQVPVEEAKIVVEVWWRDQPEDPYLIWLPASGSRRLSVLRVCPSQAAAQHVLTRGIQIVRADMT